MWAKMAAPACGVLMLLAGWVGAEEVDRRGAYRVAEGVFDRSDLRTLGLRTIRGEQKSLYRATAESYRFCHHPNLALFRGRMYVMWSNGVKDEDAPGQRVLYCHSDDGRHWSSAQTLVHDREGEGICVAVGFLPCDERLVAFFTVTGGKNFHPDTALFAITSGDGKSWGPRQRVTSGFFIEAPNRLSDGRLLLAGEYVGAARDARRMRLLFTDRTDGLGGWSESRIAFDDPKVFGYTEPGLFRRRDGALVMSFRNYSGSLYASVSEDRGETWSRPTQTNFPDSTARFYAGNLPDETAVLINNSMPKQFDRSLLTIALSSDGVVFDRAFLIRGEPTKMRFEGRSKLDGWQYPNALAWKDHLYVAYSINKEDVGLSRIALADLK